MSSSPLPMDAEALSQLELSTMTSLLIKRVQHYFSTPDHRKEFEEWYYNKYKHIYVWKD